MRIDWTVEQAPCISILSVQKEVFILENLHSQGPLLAYSLHELETLRVFEARVTPQSQAGKLFQPIFLDLRLI